MKNKASAAVLSVINFIMLDYHKFVYCDCSHILGGYPTAMKKAHDEQVHNYNSFFKVTGTENQLKPFYKRLHHDVINN